MLTRMRETIQAAMARCVRLAHLPEPVEICTPRLRLRELRDEDVEALHAYRTDPEVLRYLDRIEPWTEEEVWRFICASQVARWRADREHFNLAVIRAEDEIVIGDCSLGLLFPDEASRSPGAATVGFLFHHRFWGRGYATEAAEALVRFAFEHLDVASVFGGCCPENLRSRRVLEKVGLRFEGEQEDFPGSPAGVRALVFCAEREPWLADREGAV